MAERPTSVAKSIEGLHYEQSALDRARALRDQFTRAQEQNNEKQKPREAEKPPGEGSQMVRADRPAPFPSPSGPLRAMPDRYASATKLGKEHDTADARIEAARKRQEAFKARQGNAHDHERDRER